MTPHRVTNWTAIFTGFASIATVLASSTLPLLAPYREYLVIAAGILNIFMHPTKDNPNGLSVDEAKILKEASARQRKEPKL